METHLAAPIERSPEEQAMFRGRAFWSLLLLTLFASAADLPFARALAAQFRTANGAVETPLFDLFMGRVGDALILGSLAIWLGLWVSARSNLGIPLLTQLLAGKLVSNLVERRIVGTSILMGLAVGLGIVGLRALLEVVAFIEPRGFIYPPVLASLLASLGAGISEEIVFRLGVMSFIVMLLQSIGNASSPATATIWAGNIITALLFGLAHLPLASNLFELTANDVVALLVLNGVASVAYGWVFWRYGLLMAMVTHFFADVVIHVIAPLFG